MLSVILSAQATDKAVNLVTPALFERYKTPVDLANASLPEVESYIKTLGVVSDCGAIEDLYIQ